MHQEDGPEIARLCCGLWYRGYDVDRGDGVRANLVFRGKGGVDGFQAEWDAILGLLRKEHRKTPLAIIYDAASCMQKVRPPTRDV